MAKLDALLSGQHGSAFVSLLDAICGVTTAR